MELHLDYWLEKNLKSRVQGCLEMLSTDQIYIEAVRNIFEILPHPISCYKVSTEISAYYSSSCRWSPTKWLKRAWCSLWFSSCSLHHHWVNHLQHQTTPITNHPSQKLLQNTQPSSPVSVMQLWPQNLHFHRHQCLETWHILKLLLPLPVLLIVTLGKISLCECEKFQSTLTTSEKATDRELKRIVAMAAYLLSTKVASAAQEAVPSKPQRTKYDRLRYPNKGIPSLHSKIPKPLHHQLLGYMPLGPPFQSSRFDKGADQAMNVRTDGAVRTKVQAQSVLDHSWSSQSSKQSVDGLDRHISLSFCKAHSDKSRSLMDTESLHRTFYLMKP